MAHAYISQSLFVYLPILQPVPSPRLKKVIKDLLSSGDNLIHAHLSWIFDMKETPESWREAFMESFKAFLPEDASRPISDDDVPF